MRSENYKKLLGSRVWKRLRLQYLAKHPLCEICEANGITTAATDVHHKLPIESFNDYNTMRAVAYDINNLQALCADCHKKVHDEMKSHSAAVKQARASRSAEEFAKRWFGPEK